MTVVNKSEYKLTRDKDQEVGQLYLIADSLVVGAITKHCEPAGVSFF
jgi:hypothetical protein